MPFFILNGSGVTGVILELKHAFKFNKGVRSVKVVFCLPPPSGLMPNCLINKKGFYPSLWSYVPLGLFK